MNLPHNAPRPSSARRLMAFLADSVIAWSAFGLLAWGLGTAAGYVLGALVAGGYMGIRDGLTVGFMRHRSLGKRLAGLRVVRLDARPVTLKTSLLRNWMFSAVFVGFLPFLSTVGLLLALGVLVIIAYEAYTAARHTAGRRWGDELAGTTVIRAAG